MKKALFFLTLGSFSGAGLAFVTQVLLARIMTESEFGAFSASLSFVTIIMPIAAFGVGQFWLKAFGEEGWQAIRWIKPSINFTFVSSAAAVSMILAWAYIVPHDDLTQSLLTLLSIFILGQAVVELTSASFQLEERFINLAVWQFLPHLIRFSAVIICAYFITESVQAIDVAFVYAMTSFLLLVVGAWILKKIYNGKIDLKGHANTIRLDKFESKRSSLDVLSESWPFGLAGVCYLIYFQSSIVLVKYMLGNEAAAQYSIVIVILTAIYLFPSVIYQKLLLPKIHRWANHDRKKLKLLYTKGNFYMLLLGSFVALIVYFLSPIVIPIVFSEKYKLAAELMTVITLAIPFRFVATSVGAMLVTSTHMRLKIVIMGVVAFMNVLITYALVSEFKLVGVVVSVIITDAVLLCLYYFSVQKKVFSNEGKSVYN